LRPVVLTIAGSDCSGGAGVLADVRTIAACGGYPAAAIAALTVQTTGRVRRVEPLAPSLVEAQIEAVLDDLPVAAVKVGMLGGATVARTVAECLRRRAQRNVVVDPVLRASDGRGLFGASDESHESDGPDRPDAAALDALRALARTATVMTPNLFEAAALEGRGATIADADGAAAVGRALVSAGAKAVLVTGGHLPGAPVDVLVDADGERRFEGRRLPAGRTHGTGCCLSSALATFLARGLVLADAVAAARRALVSGLERGERRGRERVTVPEPAFEGTP
jgi:hydroxymethylpyrimidine kinase/phosphomethylpyrimidine kinase